MAEGKDVKNKMNVKRLALTGCLSGLALIIFVLEAQLPTLPVAGAKLGLSNVIVLLAMVTVGRKEAFFVLLIKILLGSVFAGTPVSFIFSAAGGLSAFLAMCLLVKILNGKALWITSVISAVVHNFGQIAAAFFVMKTTAVAAYIPYLVVIGILTGAFTGAASYGAISKLKGKIR